MSVLATRGRRKEKLYAGSRRKRIVAAVNGLGGGIQADSWINDDLKAYILFDKRLIAYFFNFQENQVSTKS